MTYREGTAILDSRTSSSSERDRQRTKVLSEGYRSRDRRTLGASENSQDTRAGSPIAYSKTRSSGSVGATNEKD